jgi:diaminohydroxyphosphoribosylaminopyrimidine deaminase/5-amino-6-(5-phosphoribosylamino)uracil reductase
LAHEREQAFMARALGLARRGLGHVSPNPMVGAVLVSGGRILAEGFHRRFGGPHAERVLLDRWGVRPIPRGAVLYLTLEPCVHEGKTPPCVTALLATSIRRFEIARLDPDPRVAGRGAAMLRKAGRTVRVGLMAEEAAALNAAHETAHRRRRARIRLKIAATLDGKVADHWGRGRWITGAPARRLVARWRAQADAVLVGAGTVIADDPRLQVPRGAVPGPSRIVVDSRLRIDPQCRLARLWRRQRGDRGGRADQPLSPGAAAGERAGNWTAQPAGRGRAGRWSGSPRLIVACVDPPPARARRFERHGWEVWRLPDRAGRVDLRALARRALREGLRDLLVEPGPELGAAWLAHGPVDRLLLFQAPKVLGGDRGWADRLPPHPVGRPIELAPAGPPVPVGRDLLWVFQGKRGGPLIP